MTWSNGKDSTKWTTANSIHKQWTIKLNCIIETQWNCDICKIRIWNQRLCSIHDFKFISNVDILLLVKSSIKLFRSVILIKIFYNFIDIVNYCVWYQFCQAQTNRLLNKAHTNTISMKKYFTDPEQRNL